MDAAPRGIHELTGGRIIRFEWNCTCSGDEILRLIFARQPPGNDVRGCVDDVGFKGQASNQPCLSGQESYPIRRRQGQALHPQRHLERGPGISEVVVRQRCPCKGADRT